MSALPPRGPGIPALLDVLRREASGLGGVLLAAGCAWAARGVRYGFIEPADLGAACESAGPWWCGLRAALIVFTQWGGFGGLALALCGAAVARACRANRLGENRPSGTRSSEYQPGGQRGSGFAWAALAAGGAGLVLYNATLSAVAVVGAGLVLARGAGVPGGAPAGGASSAGVRIEIQRGTYP